MADAGRKDFSTKISEAVTPESSKSTFQKAKESVTDTVDSAASNLTPANQKSFGQTAADKIHSDYDKAKADIDDKAKTWSESASDAIEHGKQAVNEAVEYVSGVVTGAKEGAEDASKK